MKIPMRFFLRGTAAHDRDEHASKKKERMTTWYYESAALIVMSIMMFVAVALFFYNAHDQSWRYHATSQQPITNKAGAVGAHVAATLIYLFGAASFLLLALLFLCAMVLMRRRSLKQEWDRLAAGILLIGVCAALCHIYRSTVLARMAHGGLLGAMIGQQLQRTLDPLGAVLSLCTLFIICMLILTRSSLGTLIRYGVYALRFAHERRWAVTLYKKSMLLLYIMTRPFALLARWYKSLFDGSLAYDVEELLRVEQYNDVPQPLEPKTVFQENSTSVGVQKSDGVAVAQTEKKQRSYIVPKVHLLHEGKQQINDGNAQRELDATARLLEEKLVRFGVHGAVVAIKQGPVVTLFEYQPDIDTKLSKITALEDDLALALQALSIRIIAPIPGKAVVGFEVACRQRHVVHFGALVRSAAYQQRSAALPLVLGKDTAGNAVVVDLARMPHLLVAGATGSGKSVGLHTMIMSLLLALSPSDLKFILIDPKRLEFTAYTDIAHLLFPIVTDPKQAIPTLAWVVHEMERRYECMAACGARTMLDYNKRVVSAEQMPYIVVIIDELSDLMMTAGKAVEDLVVRITQMARAAGIHMIVATQRPSVDVITGLIKVNFPSRVAFKVTAKVDSRTILDTTGADKLLGRGDMLFLDAAESVLKRVHGAYVSDAEIQAVVAHIKAQCAPTYQELVSEKKDDADLFESDKELFQQIVIFLQEIDEVSISLLQRKFRVGYNRAARIIDMLESRGLIMPSDGGKMRKVMK